MKTQEPPSQPGCSWTEPCIEICTSRTIFVEDQGVRATFTNPRQKPVRKVHYDGRYFAGQGKRADYILGLCGSVDVIIELKGTDTNLKLAAQQVENTLDEWQHDKHRERVIAALIVYGRIEGRKKLPGRAPRASAVALGLRAEFLNRHRKLLLIEENGSRHFTFNNFLH
jgi:hypothetical protein